MTRLKQHPKAFVFVSLLALALVLTGTAIFGAARGGTFSSDGYSGAWEVSVYNLSYNPDTYRTSSNHRYLLENDGEEGKVLKRKYTFSHQLVTPEGNLIYDANGNPKVERVESAIGAPLPPGAYQEHSETLGVSVADLADGTMFKIRAYTRLTIYKATLGAPLAQPEVDEESAVFTKEEE